MVNKSDRFIFDSYVVELLLCAWIYYYGCDFITHTYRKKVLTNEVQMTTEVDDILIYFLVFFRERLEMSSFIFTEKKKNVIRYNFAST